MMLQREREPAWLGYKDGQLVAVELEGFHAGETVAEWESRGYRVERVSNEEAMRRWCDEVQRFGEACDEVQNRG
jgi:hypothetical protein